MRFTRTFLAAFSLTCNWVHLANAAASSDSPRDADRGQSSYVGGDHNIDPETVSQFKHLWNASFNPGEKHWARPLVHTLPSTGRQIVFTASTENRVRTFDAATGELIAERQISPPWPLNTTNCTELGETMGIMGTPVIYTDYEDGIAFFYVKSYIEDYRTPGGAAPALNGVYYLYGVYLTTLQDLYKFPLFIDDVPHDNDPRKVFIGGLVLQRPSLLLLGDMLYAGFGGICDAYNFTGSVVAVNLGSRNIYRWATQAGPDSGHTDDWTLRNGGGAGGIWQAGAGLASDGKDVFFTVDKGGDLVGAGVFNSPVSGKTHLDMLSGSVTRISLNEENGLGVQLVDWFKPADYQANYSHDIGSSGFAVLDEGFKTAEGKKIGVASGKKSKLYIHDLDNLGGYRQGLNSSDGVLQTIHLDGQVFGGIGSYPLEGGYIYAYPENAPLSAYAFTSSANTSQLFTLVGRSSSRSSGAGTPTVTSNQGKSGTGIVWVTDVTRGLVAYKAVPVNGTLVEIPLPKVNGAIKYGRPVFGDGRVYVIDGSGKLVALGAK
ncbi:hypothetical protein CC86DRAFT_443817 [Ophiobolus disseminans]|uniref:Uncharacterized protein n=1 Tax=Ophiobolus disseminans TaxID=1469910 RepID=A0A6A7AA00_9PLEO|nr:hypothetical protein CC86DRAFT_443817 [Ophiobolus disseminans]